MARRFGRNLRRRLRETVAAQQAQLKQLQEAKTHQEWLLEAKTLALTNKLAEANDTLNTIYRSLPRMASILPPAVFTVRHLSHRLEVPALDRAYFVEHDDLDTLDMAVRSYALPLKVLVPHIKEDAFENTLHVELEEEGTGRFAYAVTEEAIRSTPEYILVERIASVLSKTLAAKLKVNYGNKP